MLFRSFAVRCARNGQPLYHWQRHGRSRSAASAAGDGRRGARGSARAGHCDGECIFPRAGLFSLSVLRFLLGTPARKAMDVVVSRGLCRDSGAAGYERGACRERERFRRGAWPGQLRAQDGLCGILGRCVTSSVLTIATSNHPPSNSPFPSLFLIPFFLLLLVA